MNIHQPLERKFYFTKQIDQDTISQLTRFIHKIDEDDKALVQAFNVIGSTYNPEPIEIYIDSYGGTVYQTLGLISVMNRCKTPIHTICTGTAMSGAFLILLSGHRRFCHEYSTILHHQLSSAAWGTYQDMTEQVTECKRLQKVIDSIILSKTHITKSELANNQAKKIDWYMDAKQALKYGVVDKIL